MNPLSIKQKLEIKPAGRCNRIISEQLILLLLLLSVAGLFVSNNVLWRWDNLLYDAQLSFWTRPVSEDIIIVAIDDESLNKLGRWPWPRSIHAKLIRKLETESPRAIGLDIIFSEPDANDPLSDVLLARAMRASGKVVLPVFMTQESSNSYPIEALPLPEFTSNAAALGHVHLDISKDGIARRIFLREGIGEPHWLHYSLAMLSITDEAVQLKAEIEKNPGRTKSGSSQKSGQQGQYSSMRWSKEYPYLIPYAGPPGHFSHIGYSQVLSGNYPKDLFRNKLVLVGTTAEGMGDALPTPLSGNGGIMPGVEIIANVMDAIRNNIRIDEIQPVWLLLITLLLVALPLLIYPFLNPANTLIALFSILLGTVMVFTTLLLVFGFWIPFSTVLLFQFVSYPLWSWRRLAIAMRYINAELDELSKRQNFLSIHRQRNLSDEIRFISQFVPIKGWVLLHQNGAKLQEHGVVPVYNLNNIKKQGWTIDGYRFWSFINYSNQACILGLSVGIDTVITDEEQRLLDSLITPATNGVQKCNRSGDVLQEKIQQVQTAGSEYEQLRRIIDDGLSGMADGILICNSHGQVMLSNHRAGWYLYGDDHADIDGKSLLDILQHIHQKNDEDWRVLLQRVMFRHERVLSHAQHEAGRDLMVEISPLRISGENYDGFVINFSDISMLKASERSRNEILNFLSHDLRSPLSSMLAMIELAKNKTSLEEMQLMLQNMENNTHKTLHLAEQFLQLSRANTNENINFYDSDFNSVVLNAIDQIWPLSNKKNIVIHHDFDSEELWIHAEPELLERAILNLLSNAIKHSEPGQAVNVSVTQYKNEISCCVMDYGTGISHEELPHLFEMFRRTQDSGVERKPGIGLGLAFVNAVAKRHSGYVDVESRLGEGSNFCFKFPKIEAVEPVI